MLCQWDTKLSHFFSHTPPDASIHQCTHFQWQGRAAEVHFALFPKLLVQSGSMSLSAVAFNIFNLKTFLQTISQSVDSLKDGIIKSTVNPVIWLEILDSTWAS